MLGMDMPLDADLGIDSIKRVEILSALQERIPDAPPAKAEHLGTLHTLRDIVTFLGSSSSPVTLPAAPAAPEAPRPFEPALTPDSAESERSYVDLTPPTGSEEEGRTQRIASDPVIELPSMTPVLRSVIQVVPIDLDAVRPNLLR